MKVLKRSGTYVHFMPHLALLQPLVGFLKGALWLGPRYRVVLVAPSGARLAQVAGLVAEGRVKPVIHIVLPLERAA